MDKRKIAALLIFENPERYKICEGCDSILGKSVNICPNCKSYRFNEDEEDVASHAKKIGNREQTTVTEEDLFS